MAAPYLEYGGRRTATVDGRAAPLLVGEAPNREGRGRLANTTRSGSVIASLGGRHLPRTNLLREWPGPSGKGSAFPLMPAREAADRLLRRTLKSRPLVLLGTRVAGAFRLRRQDYELLEWLELRGRRVAVFPHPSGVNHWWNEPDNREAARIFLAALCRPM